MKILNLFGIDFFDGDLDSALKEVVRYMESGTNLHKLIFTPNPEMIVEAEKNQEFYAVLKKAWMSLPDGVGIMFAMKFLNKMNLTSRITGSDFTQKFLETNREYKIFLLGGAEGVAKEVQKKYPQANIVGVSSASASEDAVDSIVEQVNASGAEMLFVAFGAPKQEYWLSRNIAKMPDVRLGIGVGGSFDFIVGKQKRAPKVFRDLGLEWLWRLSSEPLRYKRIFNAVVMFPLKVLKRKFF
jgi:N-acetylglucosaminyldiphosphoundecaprenol N-acetyl-beta-D-mannosaminyltransferase